MKEMNARMGDDTHAKLRAYAIESRRSMADIINEALCDWLEVASEPRPPEADPETFWSRVNKTDDCWLWGGNRDRSGYGRAHGATFNVASTLAHRVAWTLAGNSDPGELCVLHHCDNPPCVRPDHLFLGTRSENSADMMKKGRHRTTTNPDQFTKGSRNGKAKLTETQVVDIRKRVAAGETQTSAARSVGVSLTCVNRIVLGNGWRHTWPYFEPRASHSGRRG